jgi:hypothetical protein
MINKSGATFFPKNFPKLFFTILFIILNGVHTPQTHSLSKGAIAGITVASVGISTAGIYGFCKWLHAEEKVEPTLDNLNVLTFKHTKQHDPEISLFNIDQLVLSINGHKTPECVQLETPSSFSVTKACGCALGADGQALAELEQAEHLFSEKLSPELPGKKLLVEKGITASNSKTLFIFSRGYARTNTPYTNDNALQVGGCAMAAYIPIQDNVINDAPCVTFDYPDRRRCFNFGQKKDARCLEFVHAQALQKNPDADIVLIGDCRGAKAILEFASQNPKNIKALVLLSPFFSARELTEKVSDSYLGWLPGASQILHGFFKNWFPSYDPSCDHSFYERVAHIPAHMPIFIAHRTHDTLVSNEHVSAFIAHLRATDHDNIHFIAVDDRSALHSRLTPVPAIQLAVNQFLCQYGLPHNKGLLKSPSLDLQHAHPLSSVRPAFAK